MMVAVAFRNLAHEHFFKATVTMLVGFQPALRLCFHGNGREHQRVCGDKYDDCGDSGYEPRENPARPSIPEDLADTAQ